MPTMSSAQSQSALLSLIPSARYCDTRFHSAADSSTHFKTRLFKTGSCSSSSCSSLYSRREETEGGSALMKARRGESAYKMGSEFE